MNFRSAERHPEYASRNTDRGSAHLNATRSRRSDGKYGAGRPVELGFRTRDGLLELPVRDQGIGISTEACQRIFDRFERAVPAQNDGGLGPGLYIVRQIVDAVGGEIAVESTPGQGSMFTVQLPLAAGTELTSG